MISFFKLLGDRGLEKHATGRYSVKKSGYKSNCAEERGFSWLLEGYMVKGRMGFITFGLGCAKTLSSSCL